jgi:hypothetical protein
VVSDRQWAQDRVERFPRRWQSRLMAEWARRYRPFDGHTWTHAQATENAEANTELRRVAGQLEAVRLSLDATDSEVCARAEDAARECVALARLYARRMVGANPAQWGVPDLGALLAALERKARAWAVEPPKLNHGSPPDPAIARLVCPKWWRRALRKAHAKHVEGAAIALGYVNRARDCYVSDESAQRRAEQNRRNADALASTIARNEAGQEFTLAELAAKGTANKAIRRAELMTRIAGFERIAKDMGHAGLFMTITCPSRMHKWRTVQGGGVVENRKYDDTTPREAQGYLSKVWARIRAALARVSVRVYGFRIAEPNHDGTPHWHFLLFHVPEHYQTIRATVRHYALQADGHEPGAQEHRADFKPIDWTRGSAAGYIAKYVAKNIDGYKVGADLYGNDALETSARVEAWAATWGIRQFQQVGGPPVTVWRELRRVESVPVTAPGYLREAHEAVNRHGKAETETFKAAAWDRYCKAQGGVFCGRRYRIRISKGQSEGLNAYGEPRAPVTVGVEVREFYTPAHMAWMNPPGRALRVLVVESNRQRWETDLRFDKPAQAQKYLFVRRCGGERQLAVQSARSAPWTRVNNCTGAPDGNEKNRPPSGGSTGSGGMGQSAHARQSDGGGIRGPLVGRIGGGGRGIGRDAGRNPSHERAKP